MCVIRCVWQCVAIFSSRSRLAESNAGDPGGSIIRWIRFSLLFCWLRTAIVERKQIWHPRGSKSSIFKIDFEVATRFRIIEIRDFIVAVHTEIVNWWKHVFIFTFKICYLAFRCIQFVKLFSTSNSSYLKTKVVFFENGGKVLFSQFGEVNQQICNQNLISHARKP